MRLVLVSALLVLCPAIPAADDRTAEDKARLQGTWDITRAEEDGEAVPDDALDDQVLVFEGDKYFVKVGDEVVEEGTYVIRAEESPREIDLKIVKGDDAGSLQLGLYKFDGENLQLALGRAGSKDRPKVFKTQGDGAARLTSTLKKASE
jgi:uncharacterized protein (TIGR03067 family)